MSRLAGSITYLAFTAGGFHVPSIMEGGFSFGQYSRSMGMNLAFGANDFLA
jgi:hypothetical protein